MGILSATDSKKPLGAEIVLVSNEVQLIHENAIKNGAIELKAPETKPWGQIVSYIRCPSGILIELCTPIGK